MADDEFIPVIHRHAIDEIADCRITVQALVHIVHYEKAASLFVEVSKQFNRPINVVSIGCGEMRELEVFWNTFWVKKSDILQSYTGVDIEICEIPVANVKEEVKIKVIEQDLMEIPKLPFENNSIDLIIATEFIEHVPVECAELMMDEFSRILIPKGTLYLSTPNGDIAPKSKYHYYQYNISEMMKLAGSNNLFVSNICGDFAKINAITKIDAATDKIAKRFGPNFARLIAATEHPNLSNGVTYTMTKSIF